MDPKERIIDLTRTLDDSIKGVETEVSKTLEKDGWNASYFKIYSHVGTHMDAPFHFEVNDQTIDDIPVARFISSAWVIDATDVKAKGFITLEHAKQVEDKFRPGESLIIKTFWSEHFGAKTYVDDMPRISEEFAHWCVYHRVNILAVEAPSVADVHNLEEVTKIQKS